MAAPILATATINADGVTLVTTWSVAVNHGTASPTIAIGARLATITAAYASGDGSTTLNYTLASTVYLGETVTISTPADTAEAAVGGTQNNASAGHSVTNSSTQQSLLSAGRGKALRMMRNRCMVLRPTLSQSSSSAGTTESWQVIYSSIACSIQGIDTSDDFGQVQQQPAYSWAGYFPGNADIEFTDRICGITGVSGLTSKILAVDGNPIDHAGMGAYRYVKLKEVGNDAS